MFNNSKTPCMPRMALSLVFLDHILIVGNTAPSNASNTGSIHLVGISCRENNKKHQFQLKTFFILLFLKGFIFLVLAKMLFLAFSFLVILQFASPQVARDANYKIIKNENIKKCIFASTKKIKTFKNSKIKNVLS